MCDDHDVKKSNLISCLDCDSFVVAEKMGQVGVKNLRGIFPAL